MPETTEKILLAWTAPARPFKRRSRDFYISAVTVSSLVGLVLFLIEGIMPIILLVSLVFLFYVMSTIEPEQIEYQITDQGLRVGKNKTEWSNFGRFWFAHRFGGNILVIETRSLSGRTEIVINNELKDQIKNTLSQHLVYEQVPASFWDKVTGWASKLIPE